MSALKLALVNVAVFGLIYGVVEVSYSAYRYLFTDTSPISMSLFEEPAKTVRFDPDRGFFLSPTPSRVTRITHGKAEFAGSFHGNTQGFADRDDFRVKRSTADERRIAVLGDSFTATSMEPFNAPAWPDRVEDVSASNGGRTLEMLNFAVDGVGLANWVTILRNIIAKERYELDGIVIAVAWDDLDRKFAMFDQIAPDRFAYAQSPTWNVDARPKTASQALALLEKYHNPDLYVLSPAQFDAALAGKWKPRQWHFRIAARLWEAFTRLTRSDRSPSGFEPGQIALMKEIRQLADELRAPIAVVYIPYRDEMRFRQTTIECRADPPILGNPWRCFFRRPQGVRGPEPRGNRIGLVFLRRTLESPGLGPLRRVHGCADSCLAGRTSMRVLMYGAAMRIDGATVDTWSSPIRPPYVEGH